jgi:hypothetical protein
LEYEVVDQLKMHDLPMHRLMEKYFEHISS